MAASFDVVIREVEVYDGTGAAPSVADVAIAGDRIAAVGGFTGSGRETVDGRGLALAPGFIDVHTHDDLAAIKHADMAFKLQGGVTTCIVGNCGFGAAPFDAAFGPGSVLGKALGSGPRCRRRKHGRVARGRRTSVIWSLRDLAGTSPPLTSVSLWW